MKLIKFNIQHKWLDKTNGMSLISKKLAENIISSIVYVKIKDIIQQNVEKISRIQ